MFYSKTTKHPLTGKYINIRNTSNYLDSKLLYSKIFWGNTYYIILTSCEEV